MSQGGSGGTQAGPKGGRERTTTERDQDSKTEAMGYYLAKVVDVKTTNLRLEEDIRELDTRITLAERDLMNMKTDRDNMRKALVAGHELEDMVNGGGSPS